MNTVSNNDKKKLIKKHLPPSPILKNCTLSFIFGGIICVFGELLLSLFLYLGIDEKLSLSLLTSSVIVIAAILTAIGVFDKIAKFAGAGTLVPITGFANSVVSPAMDSHAEGAILGIGVKIFSVAGPVLLYGTVAGAIYGVIYYFASFLLR